MSEAMVSTPTERFRRVSIDWEPEPIEARLRFGLVALATDHASERELQAMLPAVDTDLFATRVRHDGHCDVGSLRAMGDELAAATELLLPGTPLDAVAYGCTSGTVAIGYDRVAAAIHSVRPGVAVTTPITAAEAAFGELGAHRVAVLTPYVDEVNEIILDYLQTHGIEVTAFDCFGLDTDIRMSTVPPAVIERAALDLDTRGADAVFICCTALRSGPTIEPLERALGKPVVTSNQAMARAMLRAAGYPRPVTGFGTLLERSSR